MPTPNEKYLTPEGIQALCARLDDILCEIPRNQETAATYAHVTMTDMQQLAKKIATSASTIPESHVLRDRLSQEAFGFILENILHPDKLPAGYEFPGWTFILNGNPTPARREQVIGWVDARLALNRQLSDNLKTRIAPLFLNAHTLFWKRGLPERIEEKRILSGLYLQTMRREISTLHAGSDHNSVPGKALSTLNNHLQAVDTFAYRDMEEHIVHLDNNTWDAIVPELVDAFRRAASSEHVVLSNQIGGGLNVLKTLLISPDIVSGVTQKALKHFDVQNLATQKLLEIQAGLIAAQPKEEIVALFQEWMHPLFQIEPETLNNTEHLKPLILNTLALFSSLNPSQDVMNSEKNVIALEVQRVIKMIPAYLNQQETFDPRYSNAVVYDVCRMMQDKTLDDDAIAAALKTYQPEIPELDLLQPFSGTKPAEIPTYSKMFADTVMLVSQNVLRNLCKQAADNPVEPMNGMERHQ